MSDFSTISEGKTPEQLAKFMNAYFDTIATALNAHRVDVTEFHADTIMCAWIDHEQPAEQHGKAVAAALFVVDAIERFNERGEGANLSPRVGLQAGSFYLGHTGGVDRMIFSIFSDSANAVARLEGLNKKLGTRILAGREAVAGVPGVATRPLGSFRVLGKSERIDVVEIMGRENGLPAPQQSLRKDFARALALFRACDWTGAADEFRRVIERHPADMASKFYFDECEVRIDGGAPAEDAACVWLTTK